MDKKMCSGASNLGKAIVVGSARERMDRCVVCGRGPTDSSHTACEKSLKMVQDALKKAIKVRVRRVGD